MVVLCGGEAIDEKYLGSSPHRLLKIAAVGMPPSLLRISLNYLH